MNSKKLAIEIVNGMMKRDEFSRWMKIKVLEVRPGYCKLKAAITKKMLNGYYICHGGILFSIADSAFAFASNSRGKIALSVNSNFSIPNSANCGDEITAIAEEVSKSKKIGLYKVKLTNQKKLVVGVFNGTVYRTDKNFNEYEK